MKKFFVKEEAIIEEDYDLAAEKDKALTRKKNEISRIKRDIRSVRKSLKENIAKKNKSFSMLRSIHIETTSGAKQYCEKYVRNQFKFFFNYNKIFYVFVFFRKIRIMNILKNKRKK